MFMRCFTSSRCRIISLAYNFIFRNRYVSSTDKFLLSPVQPTLTKCLFTPPASPYGNTFERDGRPTFRRLKALLPLLRYLMYTHLSHYPLTLFLGQISNPKCCLSRTLRWQSKNQNTLCNTFPYNGSFNLPDIGTLRHIPCLR